MYLSQIHSQLKIRLCIQTSSLFLKSYSNSSSSHFFFFIALPLLLLLVSASKILLSNTQLIACCAIFQTKGKRIFLGNSIT